MRALARSGANARFEAATRPGADLGRRAPQRSAGPHQLVGQEQAPGIVALDHGPGDQLARHRRGIDTMSTKRARHPKARRDLADQRHAVHRKPHRARPGMLDLDLPQLRISARDRQPDSIRLAARITHPGGRPATPHESVRIDDAIVEIGAVRIADRARIGNGIRQIGQWTRHRDVGRHRQDRRGELGRALL